ncbi:MAG: response regulator transcription factor [Bacteroidota bacterium]
MKKTILIYGLSLAALIMLLKVLQYKYMLMDLSIEVYIGVIAALFTITGVWAGSKLISPKIKTVVVETLSTPFIINEEAVKSTGLSQRELEVLQLMAAGFSNQEIADKIFVSVSTVKSHAAGIFLKLDAKRRTQAILKAKELKIIG